jgi:magnesium transporter
MTPPSTSRDSIEILQAAVASDNSSTIQSYLASIDPAEAVHAVYQLKDFEQSRLLQALSRSEAAQLVGDLPEAQAAQMIERLPAADAAGIVSALPSNEQADMIARFSDFEASQILEAMPREEAADARRLMAYKPDSAGGLMITEYLAYDESLAVGDVLDDLRAHAARYRRYDVQYAYVLAGDGRLQGVLRLRDLLLSSHAEPIANLMIENPLHVLDTTTLDELQRFFDRHKLFGAPVVDANGRLVGVVRGRDVEEAAEERSNRSFLKYMGIVGGEELRTMPLRSRSARRLSWLTVNILLNVVAASVIAFNQNTLEQVIALAVFLPIISDMSGCSGNQAVAVSMRELTLGLVRPREFMRVLGKEASIGVVNGVILGMLLGVLAWMWQGNPMLGVVVAASLAINTFVAVCVGGSIPLLLERFGQDPALAAGPILTTITDMSGFFLVLTFAGQVLPYLTG